MKATFEEGTELVVDVENLPLTPGWTDTGNSSLVSRHGAVVTVSLHLTASARGAWVEKGKYALGAITTEGGKTYTLIKLEEAAEKEKPSTNPTFWQEVANPLTAMTLPADFRPPAEVEAVKAGTPTVKIGADGTVKLSAAETVTAVTAYTAAGVSP